ncbi:MAG: c-type cytochrome [Blastocatellia bacterium]|nr:c-type cytochrome [Blastocatellia bacterium]
MANNKIVLFIVGFIIGLVISFFVANSQFQQKTANITESTEEVEEKQPETQKKAPETASTSKREGKTITLEALGGKAETPNPNPSKGEKVEKVYKNIQVLKGIPSGQLRIIMNDFSEALGVKCTHCHVSIEEAEKDDKPAKQIARQMIQLVKSINRDSATEGQVSCYTCHRGVLKPDF